jgi:ATP diphosphatase
LWGQIKAQEKADRAARRTASDLPEPDQGLLDGVPQALPALSRAEKLQKLAGSVGFDWDDVQLVLAKCDEELAEVHEAVASGDQAAIKDEIGDLLFVVVNIARHMQIDPEDALRQGNNKFTNRFSYIEKNLKSKNKQWSATSLAEMEDLWIEAKQILAQK